VPDGDATANRVVARIEGAFSADDLRAAVRRAIR